MRASTVPILATLLALLACGGGWAPNAQQITTPDGYLGFTVECQRTADCYALAASSCPYTYRVLSDSWHTDRYGDNPVAAGLKGTQAGQRGEQYKPEVYERDVQTLVIECWDEGEGR